MWQKLSRWQKIGLVVGVLMVCCVGGVILTPKTPGGQQVNAPAASASETPRRVGPTIDVFPTMTVLADSAFASRTAEVQATAEVTQAPKRAATVALPTVQKSGKYVASDEAKKFFYCVTDPQWKELSQSNLIWNDDPAFFEKKGLQLHEPCAQ